MTENKRYVEFPSKKIIKSQQDDREYKLITLENELDVLLIRDVIYIWNYKIFIIEVHTYKYKLKLILSYQPYRKIQIFQVLLYLLMLVI